MRLYNAARRNRDKGGRLKELFAGRCEGIAMTLSKLGYRIVKDESSKYVAVQKGGAKYGCGDVCRTEDRTQREDSSHSKQPLRPCSEVAPGDPQQGVKP